MLTNLSIIFLSGAILHINFRLYKNIQKFKTLETEIEILKTVNQVEINLEKYQEFSKILDGKFYPDCPDCNGSGFSKYGDGYDCLCPICNGSGVVEE